MSNAIMVSEPYEQGKVADSQFSEDDALAHLAQVLVNIYLEQKDYARNQQTN